MARAFGGGRVKGRKAEESLAAREESLAVARAFEKCAETTDIETIITLTKHEDAAVRRRALRELCPCRVKDDVDEFWARVFEMAHDESTEVRAQVLHTICDGSPAHLEDRIVDTLEVFNRDADSSIRRTAHKVIGTYRKTGRWNIL